MNARGAGGAPEVAARLLIGAIAASSVALLARRTGALSPTGAPAATLVGAAVFAGAGVRGSAALLAYFISSSLLGKLPAREASVQQRGNERDAVQVLANGGIPAVLAVAMRMVNRPPRCLLFAGFGGAIAAATADTWATEIGSRFGQRPRSIINFQLVAPGASGGVTLGGLAASMAGASAIAALLTIHSRNAPASTAQVAWAVLMGGVSGSLIDSVLGASLQEVRHCSRCQCETELLIHTCGASTMHLRGQSWCNNDVVNALAIAGGATMAAAAMWASRATESSATRARIMIIASATSSSKRATHRI